MTATFILILDLTMALKTLAAPSTQTHFDLVDQAYQTLDSDYVKLKNLYADDALLKFSWGRPNADCMEGSVDEILLPFQSLETFQVNSKLLIGEAANAPVVSVRWSNYMKTYSGCSQVTSGIGILEFNKDNKVVRHVSLSDDANICVPEVEEAVV